MRAWRALRELPRPARLLLLATFLNRAGYMGLPFLPLYLTRKLGYTDANAGAMLLVFGLGVLAAAPLSAAAIRRFGPTAVVRGSLVLSGVAQIAFAGARHPTIVGALIVAWAVTAEAFRPASMTLIADLVPIGAQRQAYAALRLAGNLGTSVGPPLGGLLVTLSFPAVFIVDGATSLVAAITIAVAALPARANRPDDVIDGRGGRRLRFALFLAPATVVAMIFYQCESTMALYLVRDRHLAETAYGLLFTINTLLVVALEIPITEATARWPSRRAIVAGASLIAVGFGALAFARTFAGVALTVVVWTFGEMLFAPNALAYITQLAPPSRRGDYHAGYNAAWSVGLAVGPWLGLLSLSQLGPMTHWVLVAIAGGLAAVGFALAITTRTDENPA